MFDAVTYGAAVGAAKRYTDEHSGGSSDAVKYTEQTLTSAQQAQARENIGAAAAAIDYSTTEQDTGIKWVDGKTIYQITYSIPSGMTQGIIADVSALTVDNLLRIEGLGADEANYTGAKWTNEATSGIANRCIFIDSNEKLQFQGNYYLNYCTIWYTKTTDSNE